MTIPVTDKTTGQKKLIFKAFDIWGADLVAKNAEELIFIQVKSNVGHMAQGLKELEATVWPPNVKRWCVHWPERRTVAEGPDILD